MYAFLAATFCTVNVLLILCNAQWNIVMMKSNETCCFFALFSVVYIPMVASAKYFWIETRVYIVYSQRYSETFQNSIFTDTAYTKSRHIILLVVEYKNLKNSLSKWQQRGKRILNRQERQTTRTPFHYWVPQDIHSWLHVPPSTNLKSSPNVIVDT